MLRTSSQNSFNGSQSAFRFRKRKVTNYSRKPKPRSLRARNGREKRTERKLSPPRRPRGGTGPLRPTKRGPLPAAHTAPCPPCATLKNVSLRCAAQAPFRQTERSAAPHAATVHRMRTPYRNGKWPSPPHGSETKTRLRDGHPGKGPRHRHRSRKKLPAWHFRRCGDCIGGPLRLPL